METSWTDDIPLCKHTGIGSCSNEIYRKDGRRLEMHSMQNRSFHHSHEEFDISLYGVFDGFIGSQVSEFARKRIPAELILGQLPRDTPDEAVREVLRQAFHTVDREYFESIDDTLAKLIAVRMQSADAGTVTQDVQANLKRLEKEVDIGASATVALVLNHRLFVANVGDTRAIVCAQDPSGEVRVLRLTVDHVVGNEDENLRLRQIGIDAEALETEFGPTRYTRCLGSRKLKGGYKDVPNLRHARDEPVLSAPEIHGGIELDPSFQFLLVFSRSLVDCLTEIDAVSSSGDVMLELCRITLEQFTENPTVSGVAQAVVDKVIRMHREHFEMTSEAEAAEASVREDVLLLIRNFNAKLSKRKKTSSGGDAVNTIISSPRMPDTITTQGTESSASGAKNEPGLPLDENGKIKAYVDFGHFDREWEKYTAGQQNKQS